MEEPVSTRLDRTTVDRQRRPSGDEARSRAMQAAMAAIAEKGAAKVRMVDIAAQAGMSTGHILYHFGRKDRLLLEVLLWSEAELSREYLAADATATPADRLRLFVATYLPDGSDDERWALWRQMFAQGPGDEESRELLESLSTVWEDRLAALVSEGVDAGTYLPIDLDEFVVRTRAMLDGLALDLMLESPHWSEASAVDFAVAAMERELARR